MGYSHTPPHLCISPMATQREIPPDLTDDEKSVLFKNLDAVLNSGILYALLHGEERRSVS